MYGSHGDRLCGLHDFLCYAEGKTVLDIAMNHGLIGFEFARHGATLVHGCDIDAPAVDAAREIFSELAIPSKFQVVDVARGPATLETAFGHEYLPKYDIVLFLGIYHKLKDQASEPIIAELVRHLISRTAEFFVLRTADPKLRDELAMILTEAGLRRVHFSDLSPIVGAVEIWRKS
jgi:ribosomal protein L11 methylase PrmA